MSDTEVDVSKVHRIVFNPYDLQISIFHGQISGLYFLHVCHGPSGNFETLFRKALSARSFEEALYQARSYFETMIHTVLKLLDDPTSWLSEAIHQQGVPVDQSRVMSSSFIGSIIGELSKNGIAKTFLLRHIPV